MSPTLRKIDIPEPCKAGKEHMSPSKRGKMCSLCQKEVIDFRDMPSKQVIDYLQKKTKTCGFFWKGQIRWINQRLSQGQPQRVPYSFSNNDGFCVTNMFVPAIWGEHVDMPLHFGVNTLIRPYFLISRFPLLTR